MIHGSYLTRPSINRSFLPMLAAICLGLGSSVQTEARKQRSQKEADSREETCFTKEEEEILAAGRGGRATRSHTKLGRRSASHQLSLRREGGQRADLLWLSKWTIPTRSAMSLPALLKAQTGARRATITFETGKITQ
jgi:hypothetical protein